MNTKNAPERIELAGGYYFERSRDEKLPLWLLYRDGRFVSNVNGACCSFYGDEHIKDFAAALQPQVGEGDEALAREIYHRAEELYISGFGGDDGTIATILAKHRQSATDSLRDTVAAYLMTVDLGTPKEIIAGRQLLRQAVRQPVTVSTDALFVAESYQSEIAALSAKLAEAERMLEVMGTVLEKTADSLWRIKQGELEATESNLDIMETVVRKPLSAYKKGVA